VTNFLKKPELLQETNRNYDLFSFEHYAHNLYKSITSGPGPAVITLVGGYGTGKSVLLNEVKKLSAQSKLKNKPKWVFFESWQYPDKRDLWEALIIDLVTEVDGEDKRDQMLRSYSDVKTWRNKIPDVLGDIKTAVATIFGLFLMSFILLSLENEFVRNTFLSLVTALVLVLLGSLEAIIRPESKSAVSRLSDYKQELQDTLKNYNGTLYIVLEDVDRGGELGVRFCETVAHFIKDSNLKNKNIKIIVPISSDSSTKELQESIEKISDNVLYFKPRYNCERFISEVFANNFLDEPAKQMLIATINPLLGHSISVRKMKHILRNAMTKHHRLLSSKFNSKLEICIAVEFSKYMRNENTGSASVYEYAESRYRHKPLFDWASQKGMIETLSDDPKKDIQPRDYFKSSSDIFDGIIYTDQKTDMSRSKDTYTYYREYLISRAYFDDL
jgi:hypothetical protein